MSDERVIEKLNEHDNDFDKIEAVLAIHTEKLAEHDEKLDKHTEILDKHTAILDKHTEILDKHTQMLMEHDQKLDKLDEKVSALPTNEQFSQVTDEIIGYLKRLDDDRLFTFEKVKRIEDDLEQQKNRINENTTEIKQIKTQLNIV